MAAVRRLAGIFVAMAACCALVACGQSSKATHTTASVAVKPTRTPVAQSMTKAQAIVFAHAVNLRPSDIPGFHISSEKEEPTSATEKHVEHELMHCVGAQGVVHKPIAEIKSGEFEREISGGHQSVSSEVEVVASSKVATEELVAIRSSRAQACLSHYLGLLFNTLKLKGIAVSQPKISAISAPLPATPLSAGYRITAVFTIKGIKFPFTIDIFGFLHGPALITLFTTAVPEPFPATSEQRLFELLVQRANTAS